MISAKIRRVAVHRSRVVSIAAPHVKGPATQLNSIAIVATKSAAAISDRIYKTKRTSQSIL